MTVKIGDETDAFEDVIPVELLVSPETVAAYGEATDANATATETLTIPASVVPGLGGLHVELSSTAMVGSRRRGAVSRRVSVRLRRAARVADARAGAGGRSRRRVLAAGHGHGQDAAGGAAEPEGAREVPVRGTAASPTGPATATSRRRTSPRICCTCSRRPSTRSTRSTRDARARVRLPRARAGGAAADERRLVAVLHRLAVVCRQGARRRRAQPGLQPHAALRLSRADAGIRSRVSPRCLRCPRRARRSAV